PARSTLFPYTTLFRSRRIAEAQHAAQVLLGNRRADRARRGANHAGRLAREGILAPGPAGPVDGVLERARDGTVVFGRHEQHAVHVRDGFLETAGDLGIVVVVIVAV